MQLGQLYQVQSPLNRAGGNAASAISAAISGKNQDAALEANWRNANPGKTVGGGIMQGVGGATAAAGMATALEAAGSTAAAGAVGGPLGLAIGAGVGILGYLLS